MRVGAWGSQGRDGPRRRWWGRGTSLRGKRLLPRSPGTCPRRHGGLRRRCECPRHIAVCRGRKRKEEHGEGGRNIAAWAALGGEQVMWGVLGELRVVW